MKWTWENRVFAWQPFLAQEAAFVNPFSGTRRATLACHAAVPAGMEVAAGPKADITSYMHFEANCAVYAWGQPVHLKLSGDALLQWCIAAVRSNQLQELSQLLGMFVILIDDRTHRRVHTIGDCLGVRPWFTGVHGGRFVAGSSVWPIQQAGFSRLTLNYDAIGSWLYYGYDLTGGSLFEDYRRLMPGAVVTWQGAQATSTPYVSISAGNARPPREEMADRIFAEVSRLFDCLTEGLPQAVVALSGGYDSRLLAALAAKRTGLSTELLIVREADAELNCATRVADAVGLPLSVIESDRSQWNLFDEPFHSLPEGFPITKQVVHEVAVRRPGIPMVNGFMGDILVRGTGTPPDREVEFEPDQTLVSSLTRRRRLPGLRFDLLDPSIEQRVEARASAAMASLIHKGREFGKPFLYSGLYGRQRCYTANNLIQHLDLAPAIAPFYSWQLINDRFANDYDCFWWETYELLFSRHLPKLAPIPHAARGAFPPPPKPKPSRATRQWAATLLTHLLRTDFLPVLSRKKALTRLIGALAGREDVVAIPLFLQRLHLLESRLRNAGGTIDWRAI